MHTHCIPLFAAVLVLAGCTRYAEQPVLSLSMPLPTASFSIAHPISDFLLPSGAAIRGARGPDELESLAALLRPGAEDEQVARALSDGRLRVALVELDRGEIRFGGETIAPLDAFEVPSELERGMVVRPLFDALKEAADDAKSLAQRGPSATFTGRLLLAVHPDAPFEVIRQLMYTCGQAQFAEFRFLVADEHPGPGRPEPTGDRQIDVRVGADGSIAVSARGPGGPQQGRVDAFDEVLTTVLGDSARLGCATITAEPGARHSLLGAVDDALQARGVAPVITGGVAPVITGGAAPVVAGGAAPVVATQRAGSESRAVGPSTPGTPGPWSWRIGDSLAVRESSLPSISVRSEGDDDRECSPHGMVNMNALLRDVAGLPALEAD